MLCRERGAGFFALQKIDVISVSILASLDLFSFFAVFVFRTSCSASRLPVPMRFYWPMAKPAGREDFLGRRRKLQLERRRKVGELSFNNRPLTDDLCFGKAAKRAYDTDAIVIPDSPSPERPRLMVEKRKSASYCSLVDGDDEKDW